MKPVASGVKKPAARREQEPDERFHSLQNKLDTISDPAEQAKFQARFGKELAGLRRDLGVETPGAKKQPTAAPAASKPEPARPPVAAPAAPRQAEATRPEATPTARPAAAPERPKPPPRDKKLRELTRGLDSAQSQFRRARIAMNKLHGLNATEAAKVPEAEFGKANRAFRDADEAFQKAKREHEAYASGETYEPPAAAAKPKAKSFIPDVIPGEGYTWRGPGGAYFTRSTTGQITRAAPPGYAYPGPASDWIEEADTVTKSAKDWTHDDTSPKGRKYSARRWRNVVTGKIVYSDTNPGAATEARDKAKQERQEGKAKQAALIS